MSPRQQQGLIAFVRQFASAGFGLSALIGAVFAYLSGDWVVLPGIVMIWVFWHFLPHDDAPPGLQFSFSYHLFQIIAGSIYTAFTGRFLVAHQASQYRQMMLLAVIAISMMFVGFLIGDRWTAKHRRPIERVSLEVKFTWLLAAYVAVVASRDTLMFLTYQIPAFAQAIVAISAIQMGLLYLLIRHLFRRQQYVLVLVVIGFETIRGFSGFYSTFKEPIMLALIGGMEVFRPQRITHWLLTALLIASVISLSVVWLGIRGSIRESFATEDVVSTQTQRLQFAYDEFKLWWISEPEFKQQDMDALAERVWDIYYTALALDRVPAHIPHEDGAILSAAIQHVLIPRFLNPNKAELPSESEDVYKFTGLKVAGREQNTTIAFGYVIQSYIDFGIPLMFLVPLGFGMFLGIAYRVIMTTIHHEEILIALLAVAFWANIMPYNTALAKMFGRLLTSLIYIGGAAVILDHFLYIKRVRRFGDLPLQQQPTHIR